MSALRRSPGTEAALADGTRLRIRPIRPEDKAGLMAGMTRLSAESRRRRFFSAKDRLSESALAYLTEVDQADHFAWVALAVDEPGRPIVGVARYVRVAGQPGQAEIALTVVDDYQGRGLGSLLFEALAVAARTGGIERFVVHVLHDNIPMRRIVEGAGGHLDRDEPGVLRAVVDISSVGSQLVGEDRYRVGAAGAATPRLRRPRRSGRRGGGRSPFPGAGRARARASGARPGAA